MNPPSKLVFVVDDNCDMTEVLTALIEMETGFETATAENGREALEAAHRRKPDVVLLDIRIPYVNGIEVARKLRMAFGDSPPLLVALTGGDFEVAKSSKQFDHVLPKPFDWDELAALLPSHTRR